MKKRNKTFSSVSQEGETDEIKLVRKKNYYQFEEKVINLQKDLKNILFDFIGRGILKEVKEDISNSKKAIFLVTLYTGEEITFDCSFLNRVGKEKFACIENSRTLIIMLNPKTVNYYSFKEKIYGEVMKRFVGFQTEYVALQVLEKVIQEGKTKISAVRKGGFYEDLLKRSDILIQWEDQKEWVGINIKTNKVFYEKSLKYFRGKIHNHGNPVLTSLSELRFNSGKFINNVEKIVSQYFSRKQRRLE